MDIGSTFESKYLKASDLQGRTVTVQIESVRMEEIDKEDGTTKAVMYFVGKKKGVIINVTKAKVLEPIFGSETDNWIGQSITLSSGTTTYRGEAKACINFGIVPVVLPVPQVVNPPAPQAPQAPPVVPVSQQPSAPQAPAADPSFTAEEADAIKAQEIASQDVGDPPF